ncbi:hypothetical protein [Erythrobacter sp. F6033]|uniref:hypothetical protein n=1 Tax=Erythrobacter sp. F6033 TaxID=2926401 RepID=UPI001FF4F7FA|nr:hypothetical protein [Erythrobacter sp. F6033]MCK0127925.1 hypothetical protein [Erythrobacter sp. F6033]
MIDPVEAFENQFDPVEDGYIYYPSTKSGGKLVTPAEYDQLLRDWKSTAKGRRFWGMIGFVLASLLIATVFDTSVDLPDWFNSMLTIALVVLIMIWLFWNSFAPRRLVKGRPDHSPPRSREAVLKAAHEAVPWYLVIFVLVISGGIFGFSWYHGPESFADWGWLIASGAFLTSYLWLAYKKWTDWRE